MKTIVGLFEQPSGAEGAVRVLESAGIYPESKHMLRSTTAIWQHLGCTPGKIVATDFAIGAAIGVAVYSLFGVLVAVGEVTVGFDQLVAIGALLIFMLVGVLVGGMLGGGFGLGDAEQETRLYLWGIRRGGVLLVVRTADAYAQRALDLLRQTDAVGVKLCWRTSDRTEHHGLPLPKDRLSVWTRWVARGLGLALILLVTLFFVGEGLISGEMPNLLVMSLTEDLLLVTLLMTLLGIIVAWRWEGIGGLLVVGSVLLFESINAIVSGYWRFGVLDPLFYLVGLLFLWDWWRTVGATLDRHTTLA
jgi:hypothetical protein